MDQGAKRRGPVSGIGQRPQRYPKAVGGKPGKGGSLEKDCEGEKDRFELSRRRDTLSWMHHKEVAALPEQEHRP